MTKRPPKAPRAALARLSARITAEDGAAEPPESSAALIVDVVWDDADWLAFGDASIAVTEAAAAVSRCAELAIGHAEAAVALASDAEVRALNAAYRGKPKPTNVLSFPAFVSPGSRPAPGERRMLGDIILARETVLHEAAEQGLSPRHHLQHLVVHALLHLLGYDHDNEPDARAMEALEVRILAGMGIPDPYGGLPLETGETKAQR